MTLMRFNPFAELATTRARLDRLFGRGNFWDTEGVRAAGEWAPAADIVETETAIALKAEFPGFEAKDIAVTVEDNILTLKGERRLNNEAKKENYHRLERAYGTFTRAFVLPGHVDTKHIEANFKDGLLTLTMPKKAADKARAIAVTAA